MEEAQETIENRKLLETLIVDNPDLDQLRIYFHAGDPLPLPHYRYLHPAQPG